MQILYTSVAGRPMGVLHDRKAKTWIALLAVQGQSFMLLDEGDVAFRAARGNFLIHCSRLTVASHYPGPTVGSAPPAPLGQSPIRSPLHRMLEIQ